MASLKASIRMTFILASLLLLTSATSFRAAAIHTLSGRPECTGTIDDPIWSPGSVCLELLDRRLLEGHGLHPVKYTTSSAFSSPQPAADMIEPSDLHACAEPTPTSTADDTAETSSENERLDLLTETVGLLLDEVALLQESMADGFDTLASMISDLSPRLQDHGVDSDGCSGPIPAQATAETLPDKAGGGGKKIDTGNSPTRHLDKLLAKHEHVHKSVSKIIASMLSARPLANPIIGDMRGVLWLLDEALANADEKLAEAYGDDVDGQTYPQSASSITKDSVSAHLTEVLEPTNTAESSATSPSEAPPAEKRLQRLLTQCIALKWWYGHDDGPYMEKVESDCREVATLDWEMRQWGRRPPGGVGEFFERYEAEIERGRRALEAEETW